MTGSRGGRRAALAALLSGALLVAACTVPDSEGDRERKPPPPDVSIAPPADFDPSGSTPTTTEPAPARGHDITDPVFSKLGDPRIDVKSYDVTLNAAPEDPTIEGHVDIELTTTAESPLSVFTLDLRGPAIIQTVVDGNPAEATGQGYEWTIRPATPILPRTTTTVSIDYGGVPDQKKFPAFDDISVGWQQDDRGGWFTMSEPFGTATWVPVNDHPSDKATWKVTLVTPKGATGVSNGHLVEKEPVEDRIKWIWEEDQPMASYLVLAAVGDYDLVTRQGFGGTDMTFAFAKDLPADKREGFDETDEILEFFEGEFGPLPGPDLGAIVVDRSSFPVALETQSRPLFASSDVRKGRVPNLAHELAHQWFGDDVSISSWKDLWLNEGFATYADWLYQAHRGTPLADIAEPIAEQFADDGLTVRDRQAAATFDQVVYQRGALTLYALGKTIGEGPLNQILRTWVRRHSGANATTEDFVALASRISGRDLTGFFKAWLDDVPQPKLPR